MWWCSYSVRPRQHLAAFHKAPRILVNIIAAMQNTAIVPDDQVIRLPLLVEHVFGLCGIGLEFIEQRLAVFEVQAGNVRPFAAAKVKRLTSRSIVPDNDRVDGAWCIARIIKGFKAWPQLADAGVRGIMLDGEIPYAILELGG